jgi:hypothetical protein
MAGSGERVANEVMSYLSDRTFACRRAMIAGPEYIEVPSCERK